MDRPTDKQVREFWKWCGFEFMPKKDSEMENIFGRKLDYWIYPNGLKLTFLPDPDLNNLDRYAVPQLKVYGLLEIEFTFLEDKIVCRIHFQTLSPATSWGQTLEDALFWAVYPILKEANK